MFRWDAPSDVQRWQRELDRIAPRTERGPSWLKLVWLAGDQFTPDHRVQRWGIYQMVPAWRAPFHIMHELRGPNPRWFLHWDRVSRRFIREREFLINREQWELYRETGCWGKLYWIVQGPPGGHRRRWDDRESRLSQVAGGPEQPPAPGDAEFQPMSFAVLERLREHELIRRFTLRGMFIDKAADMLDQEELHREREFRQKLWDMQTDQVMETLQFTHAEREHIRDSWRRIGKNTKEKPTAADVADLDQVRDEFIHAEG